MTQSLYVQIKRIELLEYVSMVETLDRDHTRLTEQINDCYHLASIVDATWQHRLDNLSEVVLNCHPSQHQFERGLLRAYGIMGGHEE